MNGISIDRADFAAIAQWVKPNAHVLDLGCGTGLLAAALAPHVAQVHAIDASPASGLIAFSFGRTLSVIGSMSLLRNRTSSPRAADSPWLLATE